MNDAWYKMRTLNAKRTIDFIRAHPEGVTISDFRQAKIIPMGIDRLLKLGLITGTMVREPNRGPRSFHWLWKRVG